jgi:hypothetical protein
MSTILRHDVITVHSGVREADFERFMKEELIPDFSKRYRGPTRMTDLVDQSFSKDTEGQRKYLWMTVWVGFSEHVRGSSFENNRWAVLEETQAMLKKLESYGKRDPEKVYDVLVTLGLSDSYGSELVAGGT